jgi:uncharacterized membrane protein
VPGTNVKTVSLPVGTRGLHQYEAVFVPDESAADGLAQNNRATSVTYVAGAGHVLVVDDDGKAAEPLVQALRRSGLDARYTDADRFPSDLAQLLDTDALVLVNTAAPAFTYAQQELLCHYVRELGGGLVMVGGSRSYGAGGWIGSPVAEILPVEVDPPQKKQMPRGALVLIMHSCEMPQGNYWGKQVASAAVNTLSRLDLAGVISYGWSTGGLWDYPLAEVGDKTALNAAIRNMEMGDMPDFGAPMVEAYKALSAAKAGQKHVILISDGDPQQPTAGLLGQFKNAGITCTGVAVFPHTQADVQSLVRIAGLTGGRFYHVTDPEELPQIFVKEAMTVKRALINEETFVPTLADGLHEMLRGLDAVPPLEGYVLTGPKGGLAELLMIGPEDDPILAGWQAGVGRAVAFTGGMDARWAPAWLSWGGFDRFWEQAVRWAARSRQSGECTVMTDLQGRRVTLTAEAVGTQGEFLQLAGVTGRAIGPDMASQDLDLVQVGPGQYRAGFTADQTGNYLVSLRYRKADGGTGMVQSVVTVPYAPEFRDLADNAGLLIEVARATGGRVLPGDPSRAALFSREGLKLPETPLPLAQVAMLVWVALFLTDVGVRRLAVDFRAAGRSAWAAATWPVRLIVRKPTEGEPAHLDSLAAGKRRAQKRMAVRRPQADAGRRYEAPSDAPAEMPDAAPPPAPPRPEAEAPRKAAEPAPDAEGSLKRLLDARRRARERMKKPPSDENTSGGNT